MKLPIILTAAIVAVGCDGGNLRPVANNNANSTPTRIEKTDSVAAHTTENQPPKQETPTGGASKWTQSGDPIDTAKLDAAVMAAEKALAAKPDDPSAKKALAQAFLDRAVALTEARQYASALGDYRRTLKHDPANAEAKQWIDQIIMIYKSINRSYPNEGEEPPPLPFKKPT